MQRGITARVRGDVSTDYKVLVRGSGELGEDVS